MPSSPFSFLEPEWSEIERDLPCHPGDRIRHEGDDYPNGYFECSPRDELQMMIFTFLDLKPYHEETNKENFPEDEIASRKTLSDPVAQLITAIGALSKSKLPSDEAMLKGLEEFSDRNERHLNWLHDRKRGPGRKADFLTNFVLLELLRFFHRLGSDLGTSNSTGGEGGPTVRFLINASRPVFDNPLTPPAARAFIRRHRAEIKRGAAGPE
jgi:hypothetical protein